MKRSSFLFLLLGGLTVPGFGASSIAAAEVDLAPRATACVSDASLGGAFEGAEDPCDTAIQMAEDGIRMFRQGLQSGNRFLMRLGQYAYMQARMMWDDNGCELRYPGGFPDAPIEMQFPT